MGWKKTKKNSSDEVSLLYVFTHRGRHLQDSKKVTANVDQIVTSPPTHFLFCRLFQKNTANITLERINSWGGIFLKKKKKNFSQTLYEWHAVLRFFYAPGEAYSALSARGSTWGCDSVCSSRWLDRRSAFSTRRRRATWRAGWPRTARRLATRSHSTSMSSCGGWCSRYFCIIFAWSCADMYGARNQYQYRCTYIFPSICSVPISIATIGLST